MPSDPTSPEKADATPDPGAGRNPHPSTDEPSAAEPTIDEPNAAESNAAEPSTDGHRRWWRRPRTLTVAALAVILAAAPFVPRGDDEEAGRIAPAAQPALASTVGPGKVTAEMQAEIDAVLAEGQQARVSGRSLPGQLATNLVRCALFEGQRYCLGNGWTTSTEAEVQARMAAAARVAARSGSRRERTGDLDAAALLRRQARLNPAQRARKERAELTQAARSVAKVWLLRHELQGTPLPEDFLDLHPEARADTGGAGGTAARAGAPNTPATYPRAAKILDKRQVAEQVQSYWCGPATTAMIQWGWYGKPRSQAKMASVLGTTSAGTAITDIVRVVNRRSGWDRPTYAGKYVALDISDWSFNQWWNLIQRHVADYKAPVVLHPVLLKRFYPYLDDDASGHFQVGRGYHNTKNGLRFLGYFEPWNQQRFDRSEPFIARVQWRRAYRSYRANQAHFQHNIGV
ncbi:C39 family peptidase [Nocardioides insulae]|uniref:C39 family peptidase n=1 Tax=Nocardioides insulae TaxID=394734 RepID=UPI0003FB306A|nr:C39 family peptidase [Nocardioides insulae]